MSDGLIIDQLKRNQILELLQEGKRIDGRQFDESRELTIDVSVIPKAEGSARASLGDTECGWGKDSTRKTISRYR